PEMNTETIEKKLERARGMQVSGELSGAEGLYREVLKTDRGNRDALHLLGVIMMTRGDYERAVDYMERAIRSGEHTIFYSNLATAYLRKGEREKAESGYRRALELHPDNINAINGLANILGSREEMKSAVILLRDALERNGEVSILLVTLGNIYSRMRRYADSLECFDRSLAAGTRLEVPVHLSRGRLLRRMGRSEEAAESYRRVLELEPENRSAAYQLARILHDEGEFDRAAGQYRSVIEKFPDYATAWRNLVLTRKWSSDDTDMKKKLLWQMEKAPPLDKAQYCFALGKFYNDCGDYDRAFSYYREGNRIIDPGYDYQSNKRFVDAVIDEHMARKQSGNKITGHPSTKPVFIVGMPRSGTTLASSVLSRHPAVTGVGELMEVSILVKSLKNYLGSDRLYPYCIGDLSGDRARELAGRYLENLEQLAPGAERVIDKLPQNFIHLGFIELLFPNATVIHCRRNPLDTCLSCYFQFFIQSMSFAFDLQNLAKYYQLYRRFMDYWSGSLSIPLVNVDYEEMVRDLPGQARRLVEGCTLEWDDSCLDHRGGSSVRTASRWQVRQPVYTSSMNRWKNYRKHIKPLLEAFPEHVRASGTDGKSADIQSAPESWK
ncbi:MAG: tetratricopeptide repeat protein, partial [Candidatus Latescibacteria bacterium]|nr:tetratricopeptide repeat protein [bacterium]MBD3425360.1 tetratricopeptide repeat protein [Candidatus Latescibacterota bacterium]